MNQLQESQFREGLREKQASDLIDEVIDLRKRNESLVSENSRAAGRFGHMTNLMNARQIPHVKPIHRRVELLCLALDQCKVDLQLAKLKFLTEAIIAESADDESET